MDKETHKRANGQFFTTTNPFFNPSFYEWYEMIPTEKKKVILEPFAGANNIVVLVNELGVDGGTEKMFKCYDIDTSHENQYPKCKIEYRDTIANMPEGYHVAITNPPYLARNSATRRGLVYPECIYDDIYKLCVDEMLQVCEYVAAIIPESFITSGLFHNRLYSVISLTCRMFDDTECPVCLALFVPTAVKKPIFGNESNFYLYRMKKRIGTYEDIMNDVDELLTFNATVDWIFNVKDGNVGIRCVDNAKKPSIEFINGNEIDGSKIKVSSRAYTRVDGLPEDIELEKFIKRCNVILFDYRQLTSDIGLTSFKGLRDDEMYRRRLDFKLARQIMNAAVYELRGNDSENH